MNTQWKYLVRYSLPSMIATVVEPIAEFSDSYFLGQMGVDHLAALGGCLPVLSCVIWILNFLMYVSSSAVARSLSLKDYGELSRTIKVTVMLSLFIGSVASLFLYSMARPILSILMGLSGVSLGLAVEFFRIRILALPCVLLFLSLVGVLRGLHRVKDAFYIICSYALMTIVFSWLFIKKFGLGISGAAWANNLSFILSSIAIVVIITNDKRFILKGSWSKFSLKDFKGFTSIAGSQFLRTVLIASVFIVCSRYANRLGVHEGAAWQLILNFWLLPAYFLEGLSITATTIGAFFSAQSKWEDWLILSRRLVLMSIVIASMFSIFYSLNPNLARNFSSDENVLARVEKLWIFLVLVQIPNAYTFIVDGLMFGLGGFAFLSRTIFQSVVFGFMPIIFLAKYLNWGVSGPFLALICFYFVRVTLIHRFLLRKWRSIKNS